MTYLSPLQSDLQSAGKSLVSQHGEDVSLNSAEWLVSVFKHLARSAAQETAAKYMGSIANPFDQWVYPEKIVGYRRHKTRNRTASESTNLPDVLENNCHTRSNLWSRKRPKRSSRTWSISMPSGDMMVSIPSIHDPRNLEEVGMHCNFTQNNSTFEIHARFLRSIASASQATICAQLNAFTQVDYGHAWDDIFRSGTVSQIDSLLCKGTISPFFLDTRGNNIFLFVSTLYLK
jgi:hypothetical protein